MNHDPDGRRLPIRVDATSNGEFAPIPLPAAARAARLAAEQAVSANAPRLGLTRRNYLTSLAGAAACLLAMDRVYAQSGQAGGRFELPNEAEHEDAAAASVLRDEAPVIDVQLHHVDPRGAWRNRAGWADALAGFPNARCGLEDPIACFSAERLIKDVFHDSDTLIGVLSHVPAAIADNPLDYATARATQATVDALDGSPRLLLHGRVLPNMDGELARMAEQAEASRLVGFKTYTQFGAEGRGYFLDDDAGLAMIEAARRLGIRNICVHKGIPLMPQSYEHSTCRDIGVVAKRFPDMNFLVYHSGFEPARAESAYREESGFGVDTLVRSLRDQGIAPGANVYAELGSTWRFLMRDPDQAAHVLGKLLLAVGPTRILWGTDSVWYGSPQDQIQAFRAFQISESFQERFGYPALDPHTKRLIFAGNACSVYGIDAAALKPLRRDATAAARQAALSEPNPHFETLGPKTRRQFLRLIGPSA